MDQPTGSREPRPLTLLDLVVAVNAVTEDEQEAVTIVRGLLDSGHVRLAGSFQEVHLEGPLSPAAA